MVGEVSEGAVGVVGAARSSLSMVVFVVAGEELSDWLSLSAAPSRATIS